MTGEQSAPTPDEQTASFGPFQFYLGRRLLREGENTVRLGSRALDLLSTLLEQPGQLVSKGELIARVWPDAVVEEATLRVHIAALRKALGDGQGGRRYLTNVPGRGYQFVAPVALSDGQHWPVEPEPSLKIQEPTLPGLLGHVVGREDLLEALVLEVGHERLLTLVGPGGIGKTTVALSIAHRVAARYRDGVRFVDMAPLSDPLLVPAAIAAAIGLGEIPGGTTQSLVSRLKDRQMLIVLDSCEHLIDALAQLAEEVLRSAPGVHIFATSREPLRADGERVRRLAPLRFPSSSTPLTAAEAMSYASVRLFVERAASLDSFELRDEDAPIVAEICRRLEGIALAIELAAGRIDTLGVREIAALLDNRLRLLTRGRRTALPRHQTLRATLDWSYDLLSATEKMMLRRLGVFAGWFGADGVVAVAGDGSLNPDIEDLANLIDKSLVTADVSGVTARYRLLDTTRAYALEKLAEAGETSVFARRHAECYLGLLQSAGAEWETLPTRVLLAAYGPQLDNVRVALDWAFGPDGDAALMLALTAAAVPMWKHLSLMEECGSRVNLALNHRRDAGEPTTHRDMELYAALGATLLSTISSSGDEIAAAWTSTLEAAEALGDVDYQLRALWGLWLGGYHMARHRAALAFAERFRAVAASSNRRSDSLIGDRMKGVSLHLLGELAEARRLVEGTVTRYVALTRSSDILRFQFDQSITARSALSQVLWLQGFADQARHNAEVALEDALAIDHGLSICDTLAQSACPVALQSGDLEAATRFVEMLLDRSQRDGLRMWDAWGRCYEGILRSYRGDFGEGERVLRTALGDLPPARFVPRQLGLMGSLAECESRAGDHGGGLITIDLALARSEQNGELWCLPELLRIRGDILVLSGAPASDAEACFQRSLDLATRQGAFSWRLRTANSLGRLLISQHRLDEARRVVAPVHGLLPEGHHTRDALAARKLVRVLAN